MKRIRCSPIPNHLREDPRPSVSRMLQLLQHHYARALPDHKPVSPPIERPARPFREFIVCGAEAPGARKSPQAQRVDAALAAAGEHDVGGVVLDEAHGVADRVRAGRAGGGDAVVGAAEGVAQADVPGGEVEEEARDVEGGDALVVVVAAATAAGGVE